MILVLSATHNKDFIPSKTSLNAYRKEIMGSDLRGVNAMSISEITNIPRPSTRILIYHSYLRYKPLTFTRFYSSILNKCASLLMHFSHLRIILSYN